MALDVRSYELMVVERDLPWLLGQWVRRSPDKPFLIWAPHEGAHESWTYRAFDDAVRRVATGLAGIGVSRGDKVHIHLENCPALLFAYFACARLGAIAVMGNTRSSKAEVQHYLNLVSPLIVVTQREYTPHFAGFDGDLVVVDDESGTAPSMSELLSSEPLEGDRPREPMLDLRVQFTSGTTSRPKAVLSTHANTLFSAQQTALAYALRTDDICQVFVPLFHNNGLATLVMSTLWSGGTVLLQPKFSASHFWGPALQYKATWTSMPGAFFTHALSRQPVPEHTFRFWFAGVLPEMERTYGVASRGHWGMSEMITLPIIGDPYHQGDRLCIGRPAPGNEIAIRRDDGSDCEVGETGHLFVRGVRGITLFKEYLNDPEATAASFDENGWFNTGDSVRIGNDGNLYFSHRTKDMLKVGGENVAAAEIETVLYDSGWVQECAVVGKRDRMLDEVPVAFVIPHSSAPELLETRLIEYCRERLADFKVVRQVHVVAELPRAALNKIAKHRLKALLEETPVSW